MASVMILMYELITCCEKHAKFDKRTPGLFKLEFKGKEVIGLLRKSLLQCQNIRLKYVVKELASKELMIHSPCSLMF